MMKLRLSTRWMPQRLRPRLLLLVFLAVLPALVLVIYNAFEQRRIGLRLARSETLQLVRLAGAEHDRMLESARQLLLTLAQLHEIQAHNAPASRDLLRDLMRTHTAYSSIRAADAQGKVFAAAGRSEGSTNLSAEPFFRQAIEERRFVIGDYLADPASSKAFLHLAHPVLGEPSEEVRGVVTLTLDLDWLYTLYEEARLPPGSSYSVFDRNRTTLARFPDPERKFVGQKLPASASGPRPPAYFEQEHARVITGRDGVTRLYGYTRLGDEMGDRAPLMTVGIPVSIAFAVADRMLVWNLVLLGGAGLLAFGAAWFGGAIFVLRPVQRLLDATRQLESGNLSARTGARPGGGELEQLGVAFDHMAEGLERQFLQKVRAEQALQQLNQNLEQRVENRTQELQRSNEDLEQFAYVASHDLREPLRMVTSYLNLLQKRYQERLDKDANEFIGFAVDGAERMHRLIDDLLAYSRVQTKAQPFETVDCATLVREVLENLQVAIEEQQASIEVGELPTVQGDPTQLSQVFQNLIGNAIKFRGDAPPRLRVEAEAQNGEWVFSVSDNGIGIAPEHHDRIFIIFQRLHGRSRYPGTGIGLSICKKIVERHGGRIWVSSRSGEGTTFHFTLPRSPSSAQEREAV